LIGANHADPSDSHSSAIAWLLAFAFTGAGIFNAMGGAVVQAQFLRWGYPAWWNFITAALETLSAALIVLPETRIWGLALGAMVLIAAVSTVTCTGNTSICPRAWRWPR
jgi:hypothetical protein